MTRHAIVENGTNKVVNCIVWDGDEWLPPKDHWVICSDVANKGDTYDPQTNTFYKQEETL
jgi:hypothetical protein